MALIWIIFTAGFLFADPCQDQFEPQITHPSEQVRDLVELAREFAAKHHLPIRRVAFGDPHLGRTRLVIPVPYDTPIFHDYISTFHQFTRYKSIGGLLMIEHIYNVGGGHTNVWTRQGGGNQTSITLKRGGVYGAFTYPGAYTPGTAPDLHDNPLQIYSYSHPFALTEDQSRNVNIFWNRTDLRAPLKSRNCVDVVTATELGCTRESSSTAERLHLAHWLGFSRTHDHTETPLRIIHASNENHAVIFAITSPGANLNQFMTVDPSAFHWRQPKIPYASMVKNYDQLVQDRSHNEGLIAAISTIKDGSKIFMPIATGASDAAFQELIRQSHRFEQGIDVYMTVNGIPESLLRKAHATGRIRIHSFFVGSSMRQMVNEGSIDVTPMYLSEISSIISDPSSLKFDVAIIRMGQKIVEGKFNLGTSTDHIPEIIKQKKEGVPIHIIAELNSNMPETHGDEEHYLPIEFVDQTFESTDALPVIEPLTPTDVEKSIAKHLATLVHTGETIQIGIGRLFSGIGTAFNSARIWNLSIRTEMLSDTAMDLVIKGVATNIEAGFAFGSRQLYEWLSNNVDVNFRPTSSINHLPSLAAIPRFVAINSALQVDLRGQVNATHGPYGRISSPGGQVEFMYGAHLSPGGRSIIALRSTALNETVSTITLDLHGPVTTPAEIVDYVVTEHGTAHLTGKNEAARAVALINIAHPKFREELVAKALERGLIREVDLATLRR